MKEMTWIIVGMLVQCLVNWGLDISQLAVLSGRQQLTYAAVLLVIGVIVRALCDKRSAKNES